MKRRYRPVRRSAGRKKKGNAGIFLLVILILAAVLLMLKVYMPEKLSEFKERIFNGSDSGSITESVAAFGRKIIGMENSPSATATAAENADDKLVFPKSGVSELVLGALSESALLFSEGSCRSGMDGEPKQIMNSQNEYITAAFFDDEFCESINIDRPVSRPASGAAVTPFGLYEDSESGAFKCSYGIDITSEMYDDNIYAFADGEVVLTGESATDALYCVIEHNDGLISVYSHCSDICVSSGDRVKTGEIIGKAGSSGQTPEAYVHFELVKDGAFINPYNYL